MIKVRKKSLPQIIVPVGKPPLIVPVGKIPLMVPMGNNPPLPVVRMDKPSLFMDKSVLESLKIHELRLLNHRYAVIHTVILFQEIQKNTIEQREENQPDYINLIKKFNATKFPKQDHYLTMMKKELLGHTVILNKAHGVPYLVPFDISVQQLNWTEGNLSAADEEKAGELMEDLRMSALDVGTEYFMGGDSALTHRLKNDLQCLSNKNVSLADFKLEITDKLKNHLSSADPVLNELCGAFESSNKFKEAGKQAPGTVPTFEILEHELAFIARNWNFIRANIQRFPYTYHYLVVNAFLNIGIPNQRIREQLRPKADDNLSDLIYLYYLPFCNVFASSDKFHRAVVPQFLTDQQDFIWGVDLKNNILGC